MRGSVRAALACHARPLARTTLTETFNKLAGQVNLRWTFAIKFSAKIRIHYHEAVLTSCR